MARVGPPGTPDPEKGLNGGPDAPPMSRPRALLVAAVLVVLLAATVVPAESAAGTYQVAPTVLGHYTLDRVAQPQVAAHLADVLAGGGTGSGVADDADGALAVLAACRDHGITGNGTMLDRARDAFDADALAGGPAAARAWGVHAALCLAEESGDGAFEDDAEALADGLADDAAPAGGGGGEADGGGDGDGGDGGAPFEAGLAATALLALADATGSAVHEDDAADLLDAAADAWLDEQGYQVGGTYRSDANGLLTVATARAHGLTGQARFLDRTVTTGGFLLDELARVSFPPAYNGTTPSDPTRRGPDQLHAYMGLVAYGDATDNATVHQAARRVTEAVLFVHDHLDMEQGLFRATREGPPSVRTAALALVAHGSPLAVELSASCTDARVAVQRPRPGVTASTFAWNRTAWGNLTADYAADPHFLFLRAAVLGARPNPLYRGQRGDPVQPPVLTAPATGGTANIFVGQQTGAFAVAALNVTPPETSYRIEQMLPVVVERAAFERAGTGGAGAGGGGTGAGGGGTGAGDGVGTAAAVLQGNASYAVRAGRLRVDLDVADVTPTRVTVDGNDLDFTASADGRRVDVPGGFTVDGPFTLTVAFDDPVPPDVAGVVLRDAADASVLARAGDAVSVPRGTNLTVEVEAGDNAALAGVRVEVQGPGGGARTVALDPPSPAAGRPGARGDPATGASTTAWTADLGVLEPGEATLTVTAVDAAGNPARADPVRVTVEGALAGPVAFLTAAATGVILLMVYTLWLRRRP